MEAVRLRSRYVLFFQEVHARCVVATGCTARPTAAWVTQQARNGCGDLADAGARPTLLVRHPDATSTPPFDAVSAGEREGVERTPVRTPRAYACAARRVGTVRRACLDGLL
ncbi:MAG: hypothetical protein ACRDJN_07805, partial [Chloroflexota bacterium]